MDAASTLSHMCMSDELKQPICQAHVLSVLLPLIGLQDDQVCTDVTRVLAEVADVQANESAIVASGGLHAAFRFFNILYVRYKTLPTFFLLFKIFAVLPYCTRVCSMQLLFFYDLARRWLDV
jgi:hypothetical protein